MTEKFLVGIQGVPRSGTSWLGQIVNASSYVNFKFQPLFSYEFKDYLSEKSNNEQILDFLEKIAISKDAFINLKDHDLLGAYPEFRKKHSSTHLVFKQVRYHFLIEKFINCSLPVKFLLVERNPLEVLNSWRKAPREFKADWNFENEWLYAQKKNQGKKEEYFGYAKWKEATLLFQDLAIKYPEQVKIVNYTRLKLDTLSVTEEIFDFISLSIEPQVLDFIKESKTKSINHPNSVYKAKTDHLKYKTEISLEIQDYINNDLMNSTLKHLLYK